MNLGGNGFGGGVQRPAPILSDPLKTNSQSAKSAQDPKVQYLSDTIEMAQIAKTQALAKRQQAQDEQEVEAAKSELEQADRQIEDAKRELEKAQRAFEANFQSASKKVEAAMKAKHEALVKRQQAKSQEAVEAAKRKLEKANRQLEDAKRTLEKEIHSVETGNSNAQQIPVIEPRPWSRSIRPVPHLPNRQVFRLGPTKVHRPHRPVEL